MKSSPCEMNDRASIPSALDTASFRASLVAFLALLLTAPALGPAVSAQGPGGDDAAALEVEAEVLLSDRAQQRLTFRTATDGRPQTLPVDAKARRTLKSLATGDKVVLVCQPEGEGKASRVLKIRIVERIRLPDGPEARHLETPL